VEAVKAREGWRSDLGLPHVSGRSALDPTQSYTSACVTPVSGPMFRGYSGSGASIPVIKMARMTSRKRTLPPAIGHLCKGSLRYRLRCAILQSLTIP